LRRVLVFNDHAPIPQGKSDPFVAFPRAVDTIRGMAWLQSINGPDPGRKFAIPEGRTVLGRELDCDLVLEADAVSRRHAQIDWVDGNYYLEDLKMFNEPHTVPERFSGRTLVRHSPQITDLRLQRAEMAAVGVEVARRLQATRGEAVFLVPSGGYDSYAVAGGPFYDPEADAAFVGELAAHLSPNIRLIERATHINDPAFAEEAALTLIRLVRERERR
jgi:hypothetical protein